MRHLIFTVLLLCQAVSAATVWMWRDAEGVVHYSDQPVPGAKQVSTSPSNTFAAAASASNSTTSTSSVATSAVSVSYKTVAITSPAAESTITGTGGAVSVAAQLEPALAANHHVALYLDGAPVPNYPPQALSYTLTDVPRGEHSVMLVVLDARGNRVAGSAAVTFYVQQPSVLMRR